MGLLPSVALPQEQAAQKKPAKASRSAKAETVTVKPEGMTKDQGDAILEELRQIRQLLER